MTLPPPGTYHLDGSRLTLFEPVAATNPPAGSENWPTASVMDTARLTLLPAVVAGESEILALSRQLRERLAAVPADKRAGLLAEVSAEIARAAG